MPPFDRLFVYYDPKPRFGPENMAIDEALLRSNTASPILRIYEWDGDWISFGYFQKRAEIPQHPNVRLIRRWTGGGVVDHRRDHTYTLVVPRSEPMARVKAAASYQAIHEALRLALDDLGVRATLANGDLTVETGLCFAGQGGHAHLDVLVNGKKVAGGAQRRGRNGLLHQGSILIDPLPCPVADLFDRLAANFAVEVEPYQPSQQLLAEAAELLLDRYASESWLHRR